MKGRKHRDTGGTNDAAKDMDDKPGRYNNAPKVEDAAEERKKGGRVKKQVGGVAGAAPAANAGRSPRKSGGSATANPYSSAKSGSAPAGHSTMTEMGD